MTGPIAKLSPTQMLKKEIKHEEEDQNPDQNPEQLCDFEHGGGNDE